MILQTLWSKVRKQKRCKDKKRMSKLPKANYMNRYFYANALVLIHFLSFYSNLLTRQIPHMNWIKICNRWHDVFWGDFFSGFWKGSLIIWRQKTLSFHINMSNWIFFCLHILLTVLKKTDSGEGTPVRNVSDDRS